jgi:hypothetical protein
LPWLWEATTILLNGAVMGCPYVSRGEHRSKFALWQYTRGIWWTSCSKVETRIWSVFRMLCELSGFSGIYIRGREQMTNQHSPREFNAHAQLTLSKAIELEQDWTDIYYNVMNYYFWEPKRLRRLSYSRLVKLARKYEKSKGLLNILKPAHGGKGIEQEVMQSAYIDEEPFNHQLEFFFRLAPKNSFKALFNHCDLPIFDERPEILTRTAELVFQGVQPDLLIISRTSALMVEVKPARGKSSAGQVAKYASLSHRLRRARPEIKNIKLLYLANGGILDNFPRSMPSLEELKLSAKNWIVHRRSSAFARSNEASLDAFVDELDFMEIKFISFGSFVDIMRESMGYSETEQRLIDGLEADLFRRNWL